MDGPTKGKSWTNRIGITRRLRRNSDRTPQLQGPVGVDAPEHQGRRASGGRKLSKQAPRGTGTATRTGNHDDINELGEREYSIFSGDSATLVDHTDMMHGLSLRDSMEDLVGGALGHGLLDDDDLDPRMVALRKRRETHLLTIPRSIWITIVAYLSPADRAQLALANKMFFRNLGDETLAALNRPENQSEKLKFLAHLDRYLPEHLLCFVCGCYHRRRQPGLERLEAPLDTSTSPATNPIVICPAATTSAPPRTRLTHSRILPYVFVQLPLRAYNYGPVYGIPVDRLARAWAKTGDGGHPRWRHNARYVVCTKTGHLLLRLRSHAFAPPGLPPTGMRHLLYEREEYTPYFSVCAHWADGELMQVCKCALTHVPESRPTGVAEQLRKGPHAVVHDLVHARKDSARECSFCQPARRCPRCPSEYSVKITMVEDPGDLRALFKPAIVVTRYVDLGDGSGPGFSPEWDAVNGVLKDYDSIGLAGRRSIIATFESIANGSAPGIARMVNMNPKMRSGGKDAD